MASQDDAPEAASLTVIVTADDAHLDQTEELASHLTEAGLEVTEVLDFLGMVIGQWSGQNFDALEAIDGVLAVEVSRDVTLAPPEDEIQ